MMVTGLYDEARLGGLFFLWRGMITAFLKPVGTFAYSKDFLMRCATGAAIAAMM